MNKVIFILFFLCSGLVSDAQVAFEIFGGPHMSSASYSVKGGTQATKYRTGIHFGAGYKIPFENRLFFSPSMTYSMMGYKVAFTTASFPPDLLAKDNQTRFHQLDIGLLLQCDFGKQPGHVFLKAGPVFNFILWGNEKFNLETGEHVDRSMNFSVTNGYGRYNVSIAGQFGFETASGFTVSVNYAHAVMSMNNEDDGPSIQSKIIGITIGKFLTGKKIVLDTKVKE